MPPPRTAIVLSGGGSRGAYEAGVIQYVREALPKVLGHPVHIDIMTGTSVGAINASFLAATAGQPEQSHALTDAWRSLRIEELISLRPRDFWRAGRLLLGAEPAAPDPGDYRYGGILDTTGLERFVINTIPWRGIGRNLKAGHFQALAISATHVGTGHTVVFIDSKGPVPDSWSHNPLTEHRASPIGPRHALASAAIPMLFPAVKIGHSFYVDGGLRQNTPLSPAIRLGAERMLVVSLRHESGIVDPVRIAEAERAAPKPLFLAGKALNALLLDATEHDLDRMERINAILRAGRHAFGPAFEEKLSTELAALRGAPLRQLHAAHIRPSEDIGRIASDYIASGKIDLKSKLARRVFKRAAMSEAQHESDMVSYLLFDGTYCGSLIDLGYQDAQRQSEDLARVFSRDYTPDD